MALALILHHSPQERLAAAKLVRAKVGAVKLPADVSKRFDAWSSQAKRYEAAAKKNQAAEAAVEKQRAAIAAKDVAQDAALDKLAVKLMDDGYPKANPFARLGNYGAPSRIKAINYGDEADLVLGLVRDVRAAKGLGQPTLDAAKALETAAKAVKAELGKLDPLEEKHAKAQAERDALALDWERTFAAFKSQVKTAESEGQKGLFDRLFKTEDRASKSAGKATGARGAGSGGASSPAKPPV